MANIEKELEQIKAAIYGKEVRQSIHDAIKAGNDQIESYTAAEEARQDSETTRKGNETARQAAETERIQTNQEVRELIDNFTGDMVIANETTPGAVKSGGGITVAADGSVSLNETAITAVINAAMNRIYPIGKIEITHMNTNPATYLGFGTWEPYANGKTLIGVDPTDNDFNAAGKAGGEKKHTLTTSEMPSHVHGDAKPSTMQNSSVGDVAYGYILDGSFNNTAATGGNQPHNNLPPYTTVYYWRRTA